MRWRRPTFSDDRGKRVTAVSLADIRNAEGGGSGGPLTRHLHELAKSGRQRLSWIEVVTLCTYVVVWMFVYYIFTLIWPFSDRFLAVNLFLVLYFGAYAIQRSLGRGNGRNVAAAALADGYCGSCGYSLKMLKHGDDGCVVCPECGAAWLGSRIIQPHWERDREPVSMNRLWMTPDDRGRYVRVLDSFLDPMPADRRAAIGRDEIRRIIARIRKSGHAQRLLATLTAFTIASVSFVVGIELWAGDENAKIYALFCFIVSLLVVMFGAGVYRSSMLIKARVIPVIMKSEGLCAVCASSLEDLTPESDGCVVCSQCKAAWRIERGKPGDQPETA
jgi:hypothetical protein